jgi:8-oxo-dGTP diphosphatase
MTPGPDAAARCIEIIARAVVLRDGRILAAREHGDAGYHLPGGHVEFGEAVELALLRELREELGSDASVIRFMGVVEFRYTASDDPGGDADHHELNLVFEVDLAAAVASSQEAHLEFSWLPLKDLPGIQLRPEPLKAAVFRWLRDQSVFWRPMSR